MEFTDNIIKLDSSGLTLSNAKTSRKRRGTSAGKQTCHKGGKGWGTDKRLVCL